jgi:predicted GNAT family acetyltransferase
MEVLVLNDARRFAELAGGYLAADPYSTNVLGVQLARVLGGRQPGDDDIWITVSEGGRVVGAGMHTPPFSPFISRLPAGAASAIAHELVRQDRVVPGVNGETSAVAAFASAWSELTGATASVLRSMRMYRLGELRPPTGVAGQARRATEKDRQLVGTWFAEFHAEATRGAPGDPDEADRRLGARELWLWSLEDEPVSVAGHSAPATGVARVGPVYTPPAARRQGYGSAVTASATRAALESGAERVVLYTDLANPTSNAIYQHIGYVPDHDAEERGFAPAGGESTGL